MIFSLEVRRARKGDCLLLHYGTHRKRGLMLIDGGPASVYAEHLKDRLGALSKSVGHPLPVDILMVSHVDDDHIRGILDLTRDERDRHEASDPKMLAVSSLWHNSFEELVDESADSLRAAFEKNIGTASISLTDELNDEDLDELEEEFSARHIHGSSEELSDGLKVLASLQQGDRLRDDSNLLGWQRNLEFDGKLITCRIGADAVRLPKGISLSIIGPMQAEVDALREEHGKWLKEVEEEKKSGARALAAYVDESVTNLSSIVVLVESQGKKILLTGDARGDKIIEGLKLAGHLKDDESFHVDVLKVPHHGSNNNLTAGFFGTIKADHYVFSGNGEHGNPERETMEMLFKARGKEKLTVHLTYPISEIDEARELEWKKQQKREVARNEKGKLRGKTVFVRKDWVPADNALAEFFRDLDLGPDQKLSIVPKDLDHILDLLEPAGI